MGRKTAGLIHEVAKKVDDESVGEIVTRMYEGAWSVELEPTTDIRKVEKKAYSLVNANVF